jgi:hypothetical protein
MEAVAGIGSMPFGGAWGQMVGMGNAAPVATQGTLGAEAGSLVNASQSAVSASVTSTSLTATSESLVAAVGAASSNDELLGAVLLMLILEYLKTENQQEKEGLLALAGLLARQQQQAGNDLFLYSSSSLSIEFTQTELVSTDLAISAYAGGTATSQQAPGVDPGAGGLDVMA